MLGSGKKGGRRQNRNMFSHGLPQSSKTIDDITTSVIRPLAGSVLESICSLYF